MSCTCCAIVSLAQPFPHAISACLLIANLPNLSPALCNNKCELPSNIPSNAGAATSNGDSCEIAIGVAFNQELYVQRDTAASGSQQQDCWDQIENIMLQCFNNGPNTGWVNGPDTYEFFQAGIRARGDGSKHAKDAFTSGLLPSQIMCSTCGGPKDGGKCSGSDGKFPGEICCPSQIKCDDKRCNAVSSACTGDLNGCLCTFNGP
jgi:hypothetical protein